MSANNDKRILSSNCNETYFGMKENIIRINEKVKYKNIIEQYKYNFDDATKENKKDINQIGLKFLIIQIWF